MKPFQVALLFIFGLAAVIGTLIFAGILPGFRADRTGSGGTVVMWGTIPAGQLEAFIREFNNIERDGKLTLRYEAKNPATFTAEYIEALAVGRGPDLILFPHEMIVRFADTLSPIPAENLTERAFRDTFIEGAELYLTPNSTLAMPVLVDPLVMYYNRNIFNNAGLTLPPQNWSKLLIQVPRLVEIDARRNVVSAAVAMGEFANVRHAKEIFAMLLLQTGNDIITRDSAGNRQATLDDRSGATIAPAVSALNFFVQFADQSRDTFTWSRALPESSEAFVAEQLAIYFGPASEYDTLGRRNANLNFDITLVPQREEDSLRRTYGRFTAVGVVAASRQKQLAFQTAFLLSRADYAERLAAATGLAPVRRDLLETTPADARGSVIYQSAIISKAWPDPDPATTTAIFSRLVEDTLLKRKPAERAVTDANNQLNNLLR
ncbi:MAG: extracellular solute-binding protein [Candidatus Paceibacterota bacterium]